MTLTRRTLLSLLAAAPASLALGASVSRAAARGRGKLVLIELAGGNDGLNTVAPIEDPLYRRLRPELGIEARSAIGIGGGFALHPALAPLAPALERGELAVVHGVGMMGGAGPVRSHFRAGDIWDSASASDVVIVEGWIARLARVAGPDAVQARGLLVAGEAGPLGGGGFSALAAGDARTVRRAERAESNAALRHMAAVHDEVRGARAEVAAVVDGELSDRAARGAAFVEQCRVAARAVRDLDVSVVKLTLGGFDTHAGQAGRHAQLLGELARGIAALRERCIADGTWRDVVIATVSEFGRRAAQNGSGGTDHGAAAAQLVLGGRVRGGQHGRPPSLGALDASGDLIATTDHRSHLGGLAHAAWDVAPGTVATALGARPIALRA